MYKPGFSPIKTIAQVRGLIRITFIAHKMHLFGKGRDNNNDYDWHRYYEYCVTHNARPEAYRKQVTKEQNKVNGKSRISTNSVPLFLA